MKILNILRKLGILRFGAVKGAYRNAKERPIEIQQADVFNGEKDTIHINKKRENSEKNDS